MLRALTVTNIATIEYAELNFESGFTVLTGETGAGKSLLTDAIGLALGGRADSDLVRSGSAKATVTLLIDLSQPALLAPLAKLELEPDHNQITIHRELTAEGRSTVRINGRPTTVGTLRELGTLLVDLHGQHDHQALLAPERQSEFLDAWIGAPAQEAKANITATWLDLSALRARLATLRTGARDREQRLDLLRYQIEEISAANLQPGESEALALRLSRLQNAQRLGELIFNALDQTDQAESAATSQLTAALRDTELAARLDPELEPTVQLLRDALITAREAAHALSEYTATIEHDPKAIEATQERLDHVKRLLRKYGETESEVHTYLDSIQQELADLENISESTESLEREITQAEADHRAACAALTDLRRQRITEFTPLVTQHLHDLALPKAQFQVRLDPAEPGPLGADWLEFDFTANPGEPLRPLARVASGGEMARVMLAIKVAGAGRAGVPTLIFDEVDTGLSGRAAALTANKMSEIARHHQVFAISHLPQIAARADRHLRIEKSEVQGRAATQVTLVEGDDRIQEIARLLAGEQISPEALANAKAMLA